MTAGQAIDFVLPRVRDPQGLIHSRAIVLAELSDCQRLINSVKAAVTESADFTINAFAQLYVPLSTLIPRASRVLSMATSAGVEVVECDWVNLSQSNPNWLRSVGGELIQWGYIGRDMLFTFPALKFDERVRLTYIVNFPNLASESAALDIPDQYATAVLDLCVVHLLTRQRSNDEIWQPAAQRATIVTVQDVKSLSPSSRPNAVDQPSGPDGV